MIKIETNKSVRKMFVLLVVFKNVVNIFKFTKHQHLSYVFAHIITVKVQMCIHALIFFNIKGTLSVPNSTVQFKIRGKYWFVNSLQLKSPSSKLELAG